MGAGMPACEPFLRWVGSKRRLAQTIRALMPKTFNRYIESFVGGGALFFSGAAEGHEPWLSDINEELIDCYRAIRDDAESVIRVLSAEARTYKQCGDPAWHYYATRAMDPETLAPSARAARTIFLNKTGFNGLYRVNSSGKFNVPHGRTSSGEPPLICDAATIRACSEALRRVSLTCADFGEVASLAAAGDFCYFDSPYIPASGTADFTAYTKGGFGRDKQARLAELCRSLATRGVHWIASNSDTPESRALYSGFDIRSVSRSGTVSSKVGKRQRVGEVLVLSGTWEAPSCS